MNANVTKHLTTYIHAISQNKQHYDSRFPGDDFASDGCLYSNLKHLPGDGFLQPHAHGFPCIIGPVSKSSNIAKAVIKTNSSLPSCGW